MLATRSFVCWTLTAAGLLFSSGCNSGGPIEVNGTVSVDGAPADVGTIQFRSTGAEGGPTEELKIEAGAFKGLVTPGAKSVSITAYKKIGEHRVQGPESPLVPDLKSITPAKYNEKTTLTAEIKTGNPPLKFELLSK